MFVKTVSQKVITKEQRGNDIVIITILFSGYSDWYASWYFKVYFWYWFQARAMFWLQGPKRGIKDMNRCSGVFRKQQRMMPWQVRGAPSWIGAPFYLVGGEIKKNQQVLLMNNYHYHFFILFCHSFRKSMFCVFFNKVTKLWGEI